MANKAVAIANDPLQRDSFCGIPLLVISYSFLLQRMLVRLPSGGYWLRLHPSGVKKNFRGSVAKGCRTALMVPPSGSILSIVQAVGSLHPWAILCRRAHFAVR